MREKRSKFVSGDSVPVSFKFKFKFRNWRERTEDGGEQGALARADGAYDSSESASRKSEIFNSFGSRRKSLITVGQYLPG